MSNINPTYIAIGLAIGYFADEIFSAIFPYKIAKVLNRVFTVLTVGYIFGVILKAVFS